jgi:hypothetical protein
VSAVEPLTDDAVREIGYERTSKGWVPVEAAEEHERTGVTAKQWRRFSSVTARGWAALPAAGPSFKCFALASSLGKIMNKAGTFGPARNAADELAVVVSPLARDRVMAQLPNPDLRAWRRYVASWIAVGMAHRCPRLLSGTVSLFLEPQARCPVCEQAVTSDPHERSPATRPAVTSGPRAVPVLGDASRDGEGDEALAVGW